VHGTAAPKAETPQEGQRDRAAAGGGRGKREQVMVNPSVAATSNDLEIAFFLQFKIFQIRIIILTKHSFVWWS
jgi:hypothetical protein